MATTKKNTPAAGDTPAKQAAPKFRTEKETGKVIGPGTNPDEVKFEGDTSGPVYVHKQHGQTGEDIHNTAETAPGWFVVFGGTQEECEAYAARF